MQLYSLARDWVRLACEVLFLSSLAAIVIHEVRRYRVRCWLH
jgi:hypothetical protein